MAEPAVPLPSLTVDTFLAWADAEAGHGEVWELFDGEPVRMMSPESVLHLRLKGNAFVALRAAVDAAGVPCEALPDGATVPIDDATAYVPDALVTCVEIADPTGMLVPRPSIVVEVLSPATRRRDQTVKLLRYFEIESVEHVLLIDQRRRRVIHARRDPVGGLHVDFCTDGAVTLDPPGLALPVAELYAGSGV